MKRSIWKFLSGLHRNTTSKGTAVRQLAELQRHVLSLYALLCANASALGATHFGLAPNWLAAGVPGVLIPLCLVRAVHWWRLRPENATEAEAIRQLQSTTALTVLLSVGFVSWAVALQGYGGPYEQGHVAIFVAITVVACIFCLTHLPVAAFLVAAIVISVFVVLCLVSAHRVFIAIAINIAFVTVVMVRVLASNFIGFLKLIESQKEAQNLADANARLALTDSLTELPNRRYFFQQLQTLIRTSVTEKTSFALAIFDLDQFKPINDTYGHTAGDAVLAETGRRLREFAAENVTVARLGGDEFGMLFHSLLSPEGGLALCQRVCETLQIPIRLGSMEVVTGCSGGLATFPAAGRNADSLFDCADYALYHAKEHCRGATTLFSQDHENTIRAERAVETALRSADLSAEMELHYQPIFDTTLNEIVQVEALARWTSPSLGRVSPDRFIPAAERCGMIHSVTLLLFRMALEDARSLPPAVGLSFNLSSHDLVSNETVLAILAAVRQSGLDPGRLTLELTETALMRDFDRAETSIRTLRSLGIKIALDDFGTGYSSLGYVHRLPIDKIKIDRSFMADLNSNLGRSLITTILGLCENLGLDGIAEGVEEEEQLKAVRQLGCRYVQGYLIGKPAPLAATLHLLEASGMPATVRRSA